jgi:sigma-E factor negative regulatory protein RseA
MNGPRDEHEAQARQQLLSSLMDGDADASTTLEACAAWRGDPKARADWHAYHVIGDVLRTPELTPARGGDAAFVQVLRARLAAEPVVMAPGVPGAVLPASTHEQPSSDPWGLSAAGAVAAPVNARTARARPNDGWRVPAAVAAGVFAVATVVLVTRSPAPQESTVATAPVAIQPQAIVAADATRAPTTATATSLAAAPELAGAPSTPATRVAASPGESASAGDVTREAGVLRDSRVDRALDRYMTAHRQFGSSAMPSMPGGVVRSVSISAPDR